MKNVLILSTSPRKNGNSDRLAEQFAKGAAEAGHRVEKISLADSDLRFCRGCLSCIKTNRCILRDVMDELLPRIQQADVLVFATPIYYYEMSGQMKTLLDRTNPLYTADYRFRDIYLLATAAEKEESAVDGAVNGLQGWIACYEKCSLKGVVRGVGAAAPGEIEGSPALEKAFEMGRRV